MDPHPDSGIATKSDDDPESIARAVATYSTYLLFVANRLKEQRPLAEERASDLAQTTLEVALTKIRGGEDHPPVGSKEKVRAWLRRILRNVVRDSCRNRRTQKRTPVALPSPPPPMTPSHEAVLNEEVGFVAEARARLSPEDRQLLEWREDEDLRFREIGCKRGYSTSYARRAYREVRAKFEAVYHELRRDPD